MVEAGRAGRVEGGADSCKARGLPTSRKCTQGTTGWERQQSGRLRLTSCCAAGAKHLRSLVPRSRGGREAGARAGAEAGGGAEAGTEAGTEAWARVLREVPC